MARLSRAGRHLAPDACGRWPWRHHALKATAAANSAFAAEVHFPGLRTSHQLLPYYAFAGCFVLPSTREPWGLVTNEAMAAGLPVLVSNRCGCAPDLVLEGQNGFTFDPTSLPALTAHLHAVEALSTDARNIMGTASSAIIRGYSPAGFGRSIASIAAASSSRAEGSHATNLQVSSEATQ